MKQFWLAYDRLPKYSRFVAFLAFIVLFVFAFNAIVLAKPGSTLFNLGMFIVVCSMVIVLLRAGYVRPHTYKWRIVFLWIYLLTCIFLWLFYFL